MSRVEDYTRLSVFFGDQLVPFNQASLHVASSAVLYGLSVYTVFPVNVTSKGMAGFRLHDHYNRLVQSAHIIGIDRFASEWDEERFTSAARELIVKNEITEDVFVRATVHVNELVPGTRSRGMKTVMSMFIYPAKPIVPQDGVRLKSSVWRRIPDNAIPARAKVNGAYVNSVLAKQDALDSGYDDCILLDSQGHVCELSAANIFLVRNGVLITPSATSDILEGINRKTVLELAKDAGIPTEERTVDLTELYIADEVFACGTSAFIAPVAEVDARKIGYDAPNKITQKIAKLHTAALHGENTAHNDWLTPLTRVNN